MSSHVILLFGKEVRAKDRGICDLREWETSLSGYRGLIHEWYGDTAVPFRKGRFHWHLAWEPGPNYDLRDDGWVETLDEAVECIETAVVKDFLHLLPRKWQPILQHVRELQEFMWSRGEQRPTAWELLQ